MLDQTSLKIDPRMKERISRDRPDPLEPAVAGGRKQALEAPVAIESPPISGSAESSMGFAGACRSKTGQSMRRPGVAWTSREPAAGQILASGNYDYFGGRLPATNELIG
jgi:hypothetical protein